MNYKKIFINGEWASPNSSQIIEVENPANKEIVGSVPACNEEDVNLAVKAAKDSLVGWQFTSVEKRIELAEKLLEELECRKQDMADAITKELGAPEYLSLSTHVVPYLKGIESFIEIMKDYPLEEKHKRYNVVKEPIGVVGAITPWNYPLGQITKKIVPALLTGCTVVLKPSQNTPLVSYIMTEAIEKTGFPKGVFNLVPGRGSEVGTPLAAHPDVDLISFTGSTSGGREVSQVALQDIKKLTLELGGKSPAIVLKGADLDLVLSRVLDRMFLNVGQTCSALSRLIIPREEKDKIEKMLVDRAKKYVAGDPTDSTSIIGPLSSQKQFDKVKYFIEKGLEEGAEMLVGQVPKESKGYFVSPVIFTNVKNHMEIAREEIFGPVLSVIYYDTVEEALEIANDSIYGLSSAVFGPEEEAMYLAKRIRAGNTMVNKGAVSPDSPFGGYKHSGFGRENGKYGLEEFLEIKAIFI